MSGTRWLFLILGVAAACAVSPYRAEQAAAADEEPSARQPEPPPPEREATLLERVRAAYLAAPTTERLRISVRQGELPPRRSLLLVRLEPAPDAGSIGRVVLRAGRLLVEARPGSVRALLDRPESSLFLADAPNDDVLTTMSQILPPLPLASLDFACATALPPSLTPYGQSVVFQTPELRQRAGTAVFAGQVRGGTFKLTIDAAAARVRRLEITLGNPSQPSQLRSITIEHAASSADLSSLTFASAGRGIVGSLSQLAAGEPDTAVGSPFAPLHGSAAEEAVQSAVRNPGVGARSAVVLIGGLPRSAAPRPDLAAAVNTLLALKQEIASFSDGGSERAGSRLEAGFAVLWQASGADDDAILNRVAAGGGEPVHIAGLAGAEAELARVASDSAAVFVVLGPDLTIRAVHPTEALPVDPEQRVAELLMTLIEASVRAETDPKEGR